MNNAVHGRLGSEGPSPEAAKAIIGRARAFDAEFYREQIGSAADVGDLLDHYLRSGWRAGLSPNRMFNPLAYLQRNGDVRARGWEPLTHYLMVGGREGRWPTGVAAVDQTRERSFQLYTESELFDREFYQAEHPEARSSGLDPVVHYMISGARQGLRPSEAFDPAYYLARYPDVRARGVEPLFHYLTFGLREGRSTRSGSDAELTGATEEEIQHIRDRGWFDEVYYRGHSPALPKAVDLLRFHLAGDWRNYSNPSAGFDAVFYASQHPAARTMGPLLHYARVGHAAGAATAPPSDAEYSYVTLVPRPDDAVHLEIARGIALARRFKLLGSEQLAQASTVARELAGRSPLKPPPGRPPDASIIIPMFGQTSLVLGCLDSIARQKSRRSVEVIVWDDGSPASDAAEVIGHIPWVRYHRAEKNGGFLLAVNAAAKTAGGRWLLLLNSDVRVAAGWLDAILDTAESRPEAGIIGSKLFRADGRLQEAGGTVWRDGTTEHVGRGQDPESPEYATERKVDYCSAAAVCIPTTVWRDLGGFDPLFAPAYYEDTDLAFRVRETGREVWFCPEARALHYENRSYERDGPRGLSRFQVANQRRFAGRWAHVLRQLPPPPGAEVDEEALGAAVAAEVRRFTSRSPLFEEFAPAAPGPPRAKAIAFYLPQFHAVPENDEWWGRGFTEWTNLPRGLPRFPGHYQPRVPRDLGFYDLTDPTVLPRQVDLARAGGVHGFCYYYYNFGGRRLLERPLEAMLARRDVDFPFCLMWTNENWSRRWDGSDDKILMKQEYGYEQAASLVDDLARHFRDPRYIRIGGRPLLIVYRAQLVKGGAQAFQRWRELFEAQHGEQPLILMAETFSDRDPRRYGLDGAVEFPPHKIFEGVRSTEKTLAMFDANASLKVHTYGSALLQARRTEPPPYALLRTVFPSWDNDARRQGHGLAVTGSTPTKFAEWLEVSIAFAQANPFHGEPIVMINAWNEWAEGAYLEPDIHFGAAYLNALSQVIFSRA